MLKGLGEAASAMLPRIKRQEIVANNLANATTPGFKRDRLFVNRLAQVQRRAAARAADWEVPAGEGVYTDYSQGRVEPTGVPTHFAIDGDGFFVIDTPGGERYTRNGNFTVSPDGVLVTFNGDPVAGTGGEIVLPPGDISAGEGGAIAVDGQDVGTLRIVQFGGVPPLVKDSESLFNLAAGADAPVDADAGYSIHHMALERSNVEAVREMIEMIATFRFFETDQKIIQLQDETLQQTVNDLGRLSR